MFVENDDEDGPVPGSKCTIKLKSKTLEELGLTELIARPYSISVGYPTHKKDMPPCNKDDLSDIEKEVLNESPDSYAPGCIGDTLKFTSAHFILPNYHEKYNLSSGFKSARCGIIPTKGATHSY